MTSAAGARCAETSRPAGEIEDLLKRKREEFEAPFSHIYQTCTRLAPTGEEHIEFLSGRNIGEQISTAIQQYGPPLFCMTAEGAVDLLFEQLKTYATQFPGDVSLYWRILPEIDSRHLYRADWIISRDDYDVPAFLPFKIFTGYARLLISGRGHSAADSDWEMIR